MGGRPVIDEPPAVVKVGGSILRNERSYRATARLLAAEITTGPVWVVVSAAHGITDALEQLGRRGSPGAIARLADRHARLSGVPVTPRGEAELAAGVVEARRGSRDRLLAWGERASVAALRSHLAREHVDVAVVELGGRASPHHRPAALVPGFYLRDRTGGVRCLPRGGSDISAVLLAAALGADRVRLWKDGGGIRGEHGVLPEVDPAWLLERFAGGHHPLHPIALRLATRWGIDLILEDPLRPRPASRVVARRPGSPRQAPGPAALGLVLAPSPERSETTGFPAGSVGAS